MSDDGSVTVPGISMIAGLLPDLIEPLVGCARAVRVMRQLDDNATDFRKLVEDLQANGIKVIVSFIAGLDDHTEASIQRDMA